MPAHHIRNHFIPDALLWKRRQGFYDTAVTYERTLLGLAWAIAVGAVAWAVRSLF